VSISVMQRNDFSSIWPLPWTVLSSALPTPADIENTIPHKMAGRWFFDT
jgi:NIPSNAP